ncbi:hypothetical protein GWI33_007409 [Rhynchophorus ferrugineus]|uniref:Uncharacterized protein n=1 Tax=Rhynchophorus ferrugineus TaxID=354439 RepID=A0A834IDL5_RHYFE|nr:hypothetical protein GWI33_007409 [Rhynchophorus ferrugineus]
MRFKKYPAPEKNPVLNDDVIRYIRSKPRKGGIANRFRNVGRSNGSGPSQANIYSVLTWSDDPYDGIAKAALITAVNLVPPNS